MWKRDWRNYTKEALNEKLSEKNWDFTSDSVQSYGNKLENQLITIVDELVPLVQFCYKKIIPKYKNIN